MVNSERVQVSLSTEQKLGSSGKREPQTKKKKSPSICEPFSRLMINVEGLSPLWAEQTWADESGKKAEQAKGAYQ